MFGRQAWLRLGTVALIGAAPLLLVDSLWFDCHPMCPSLVWGGLTVGLLLPLAVGIAAGLVRGGWLGWLALMIGASLPATVWALSGPFPDPPQPPAQMIGFFLGWTLIPATIGLLAIRGLMRLARWS